MRKQEEFHTTKCVVEKVIDMSEAAFTKLITKPLEDNWQITANRELMWQDDDAAHCILFVDKKTGDGLLVESEGADYARYAQYIPHAKDIVYAHRQTLSEKLLHDFIRATADRWIKQNSGEFSVCVGDFLMSDHLTNLLKDCISEALAVRPEIAHCSLVGNTITAAKEELTETKLYCPLYILTEDESYETDMTEVSSCDLMGYEDEINAKIKQSLEYDEELIRGLITYTDNERLGQVVHSVFPSVEQQNGELLGVLTVKSYGELEKADMCDLIDEMTGQLSDGWGESFEQHEVRLGGDNYYISFWNSGNGYYLKPESQVFPKSNITMKM